MSFVEYLSIFFISVGAILSLLAYILSRKLAFLVYTLVFLIVAVWVALIFMRKDQLSSENSYSSENRNQGQLSKIAREEVWTILSNFEPKAGMSSVYVAEAHRDNDIPQNKVIVEVDMRSCSAGRSPRLPIKGEKVRVQIIETRTSVLFGYVTDTFRISGGILVPICY